MKELRTLVVLFSLVFIKTHALAQSTKRETVTQSIEWFALNSNIKLHTKFGVAFDGQLTRCCNLIHPDF